MDYETVGQVTISNFLYNALMDGRTLEELQAKAIRQLAIEELRAQAKGADKGREN